MTTTNPLPFDQQLASDFQQLALTSLLRNPALRGVVVVFDYGDDLNIANTVTGVWQTRTQNEKTPGELFGGIAQTTRMLEGMIQNVDKMVDAAREKLQVLLLEAKTIYSQPQENA
jgi:hypothetical protein